MKCEIICSLTKRSNRVRFEDFIFFIQTTAGVQAYSYSLGVEECDSALVGG